MEIKRSLLRGVLPPLQTLAMKAVVAQCGEDPVHGLIHPLQTHCALWELCQIHHRQAGPLQKNKQIAQHLNLRKSQNFSPVSAGTRVQKHYKVIL